MIHDRDDDTSAYYTKAEAKALIGKTVRLSSGCGLVVITDMFCVGPDQYEVSDDGRFGYRKQSHNCPYVDEVLQ